jgi:undecaprenyl-diphosphatase
MLEAIILGIIQGLTEFLPVSSSGHLELAKVILGDDSLPEESMLMTVVLHGATALSTIVFFRKDILELFKGLFQFKNNEEFKFSLNIVVSMIPAAVVGSMLLITAVLLILADKAKNTEKKVGIKEAIIIGVSQAIAIMPGISRSGATISTSVMLGVDREKAARFSFLMVVPLIMGKIAKDVLDGAFDVIDGSMLNYGVGFIAAFVTGILACTWMIKLVKKSKLKYFAYYCLVVGVIAIVYSVV